MSATNVASLRLVTDRDQRPVTPDTPSNLSVGFGIVGFAVFAALVGMAVEHYRPGGSLWQQTQALSLTGRISRMQAERCCHD